MPFKYAFMILLVGVLGSLCAGGCNGSEKALPQGVVAVVNDHPLSLRMVQALHDSRSTGLGTSQRPSVQLLRTQYGDALSTLIVHTLVMQELERLQLAVGDTAIKETEEQVRQDYPGDAFEKMLTEEYIDLTLWRELLRHSLSLKIFEEHVLRPSLGVSLDEVRAYYTAYTSEFHIPDRVTLLQIHGVEKNIVEQVRAGYPASLNTLPEGVTIQRYTIRRDSIPHDWKKMVLGLKTGQSTPTREAGGDFQCIVLEISHPPRTLSVAESYPIIEKLLLEEKIDDAFDRWLKKSLSKTTVRVSPHLRSTLETSTKTPVPAL